MTIGVLHSVSAFASPCDTADTSLTARPPLFCFQVHTLKPQAYVFKPLERLVPANSKKLRDPSEL